MGIERFLALTEEKLGRRLTRVPAQAILPRPAFSRTAHIGVHAQKQAGLNWIGVALNVGRLSPEQMRGLAGIAHDLGDGDIRLTVWQNPLVSSVPDDKVALARAAIDALGLSTEANSVRAGLVACTGNVGCRFAASDTKRHADDIARWCDNRVALNVPVNIHLTGCHHSCAQHYIGDIGLLACKVAATDDDEQIEGYRILVGGGFGPDAGLGRELFRDVKAEDAPRVVERMLQAYLAHRASAEEPFFAFTRRHEVDHLRRLFAAKVAA
jgi:ferredoxin-nitrite reductase